MTKYRVFGRETVEIEAIIEADSGPEAMEIFEEDGGMNVDALFFEVVPPEEFD
jgi:hypothetical protein